MDLCPLVSPAFLAATLALGVRSAAVVAALGYALADAQSHPLTMPAFVFTFGGLTASSLLAGTTSLNENSETPDTVVPGDSIVTPPVRSGAPRRLLFICFSLALSLAGVVGIGLFN